LIDMRDALDRSFHNPPAEKQPDVARDAPETANTPADKRRARRRILELLNEAALLAHTLDHPAFAKFLRYISHYAVEASRKRR
jgi:hypothetical protein